jgi:hypothetical protein
MQAQNPRESFCLHKAWHAQFSARSPSLSGTTYVWSSSETLHTLPVRLLLPDVRLGAVQYQGGASSTFRYDGWGAQEDAPMCAQSQLPTQLPFAVIARILNPVPRAKRMFTVLTFYADESCSPKAFNFGGWLGLESELSRLGSQWSKRIEFERRGHGKFARFHATNCNAKTGDYEGWSDDDKIEHTKALLRMVTRRKVAAVCAGLDRTALLRVYPGEAKADPLETPYRVTVTQLMIMISQYVKKAAGYRVAIIHDWAGTHYNAVIQEAFSRMRNNPRFAQRDLFVSCTPLKWQDCILLQPADMIAFDTRKLLDETIIRSSPQMRRSLQALLGKDVPIKARYINEPVLRRIKEIGASSKGGDIIAPARS